MIVFALLYSGCTRRATARDLAYSNVAFFVEAAKPRALDSARARRRCGSSRSAASCSASPGRTSRCPCRRATATSSSASTRRARWRRPTSFPTRAKRPRRPRAPSSPRARRERRSASSRLPEPPGVVQPLSADHQRSSRSLDECRSPNGATAIGDALKLAAQMLPPARPSRRHPDHRRRQQRGHRSRRRSRSGSARITFRSTRSASARRPAA